MLARGELNRAAIDGPQMIPWWRDWRGETVAIIASGPSTKGAGVELLRGKMRVIAIKENAVELCPWADVAYGCDWGWWVHRRALPDFRGLKIAYDGKVRDRFPDVNLISIPDKSRDEILTDVPGQIGSGGNSAFQAMNIAIQFGVIRILAVGLDMHGRSGAHWYGRNNWMKGNNPGEMNFRRWKRAFDGVAGQLKALGVEFVNASATSELKAYPKMTVPQALAAWGL